MLKDNKLASILLVLTLIVVGVFGFLGWKKRGEYKESLAYYQSNDDQLGRLESNQPFPNQQNVAGTEDAVKQLQGKVDALQNALVAYRPEALDEKKILTPADFSANRQEKTEQVKAVFTEKSVQYPKDFSLGFLNYTTRSPREDATNLLNYQLEANAEFFTVLANSNVSKLLNVYRVEVNPERGVAFRPAPANSRSRGKKEFHPYDVMPMEVTFQASELSLKTFLNTLANHKDYFFVVRNMRIQNQKQEAPRQEDAVFETAQTPAQAPAATNFADAFSVFIDEAEKVEEKQVEVVIPAAKEDNDDESNRILKPVLGEEELLVFLRVDLALFNKPLDANAKN